MGSIVTTNNVSKLSKSSPSTVQKIMLVTRDGARTHDHTIKSRALCLLSYASLDTQSKQNNDYIQIKRDRQNRRSPYSKSTSRANLVHNELIPSVRNDVLLKAHPTPQWQSPMVQCATSVLERKGMRRGSHWYETAVVMVTRLVLPISRASSSTLNNNATGG